MKVFQLDLSSCYSALIYLSVRGELLFYQGAVIFELSIFTIFSWFKWASTVLIVSVAFPLPILVMCIEITTWQLVWIFKMLLTIALEVIKDALFVPAWMTMMSGLLSFKTSGMWLFRSSTFALEKFLIFTSHFFFSKHCSCIPLTLLDPGLFASQISTTLDNFWWRSHINMKFDTQEVLNRNYWNIIHKISKLI